MNPTRQPYLVFARTADDYAEGKYAPWWPIYVDDGPQMADCAEAAMAVVRERMMLGGEQATWVELAAVPAFDWTTWKPAGDSGASS